MNDLANLYESNGFPATQKLYQLAKKEGLKVTLKSVQEFLEISNEQTKFSKKVLFERGNMSSATLPHVWKEILDANPKAGTRVVSFAFGPGLTIFGSIFEIEAVR